MDVYHIKAHILDRRTSLHEYKLTKASSQERILFEAQIIQSWKCIKCLIRLYNTTVLKEIPLKNPKASRNPSQTIKTSSNLNGNPNFNYALFDFNTNLRLVCAYVFYKPTIIVLVNRIKS